jgi:hypothetical protein
MIASVVVILHGLGITDAFDVATIRFASQFLWSSAATRPFEDDGPPTAIRVISEGEYRSVFRNTSPLDRPELQRFLESAFRNRPKLAVIAIDVSPRVPVRGVHDQGQQELDKILEGRGEAWPELGVILPVPPLPAGEPERSGTVEWMRRRCQANEKVYFAFPDLVTTQGLVLRYAPEFPSLGVVARWVVASAMPHPASGGIPEEAGNPRFVCQMVMHAGVEQVQQLRDRHTSEKLVPLNPRRAVPPASSVAASGVVFLGGAYDPRDRFWTTHSEMTGVQLHAAIYRAESTEPLGHFSLFVVEIVVGALLGFVLERCWMAHDRRRARVTGSPAASTALLVRNWSMMRLIVVLAVGVAVVTGASLLILASTLLAHSVWVNPAALVLGVVGDSLVLSGGREVHHVTPQAPVIRYLDSLLQVCVWLWALVVLWPH